MSEIEIEQEPQKKNIWNRLLIAVLIIIAGLTVLFFVLSYHQERAIDISCRYAPEVRLTEDTRAQTFAADKVVSENSVVLDGAVLSSTMEKALLFDIDSNTSCFAQGIYDRAYPASITKIMTALIVMKYGNLDDTVVMAEEDFNLESGSQVSGMIPGDTVTLRHLFYTLVIYSANDAATAIARHMCGSTENFVALMNSEARQLGMLGTNFTNPHGLHDPENYTCAYDVYLMLREALKYTEFTDAIRLNVYSLTVTRADGNQILYRLDSTDKFLTGARNIPQGVALWGGKTGTTPEAGSCLALAMQNENGIPFIAVILNADNSNALYNDMTTLMSCVNSNC